MPDAHAPWANDDDRSTSVGFDLALGGSALDEDLTLGWFKMLVQQPDSEPL